MSFPSQVAASFYKKSSRIAVLVVVSAVLSLSVIFVGKHTNAAGGGAATLYLSPASGSVVNGSTLSVNIYEDSGSDVINGVQANLAYPAGLLNYSSNSISPTFDNVIDHSGGGGSVNIGVAKRGAGVTGPQLVATIYFTATLGSGTANISFASGSYVIDSNVMAESLTTIGGSYTLTAPATPPPTTPPPTPSPSPTHPPSPSPSPSGSPSPSPGTAVSTGGLTVTGVSVSNLSANTATINWQSSNPATSEVLYGLTTNYVINASDGNLVNDHKLVLDPQALISGMTYHFIAKSIDASDNTASSSDMVFRTKGATVVVTVLDQNGKPVKGAKVSSAGAEAVTDSQGHATLNDMPVGKQTAAVVLGFNTTKINLNVGSVSASGQVQKATVKIKTSKGLATFVVLLAVVGVGAVVLAVGYVAHNRKLAESNELNRHFPKLPGSSSNSVAAGGAGKVVTPSTPSNLNTPTQGGSPNAEKK